MFNDTDKVRQFLRFCMVGLANTAVDFSIFFLLNRAGVAYIIAQIFSYSAGVANSFLLNRRWTFGIKNRTNIGEVARFIIVNSLSLIVSAGLLFILHNIGHAELWLSKAAATAASLALNFAGSRILVFGKNQTISLQIKKNYD